MYVNTEFQTIFQAQKVFSRQRNQVTRENTLVSVLPFSLAEDLVTSFPFSLAPGKKISRQGCDTYYYIVIIGCFVLDEIDDRKALMI